MKVAFVVGTFPSLSETFILNQITGLLQLGHEVDVYALEKGNATKVHPDVLRFDLLARTHFLTPAATARRHFPRATRNFATTLLAEASRALGLPGSSTRRLVRPSLLYIGSALPEGACYDVIHCHFGPVGAAVARLRRAGWLSGPLVTTFHGWDATVFPRRYPHNPYRLLFEVGDLFTVTTDHMASALASLGCPTERLVKHPVGIEPKAFRYRSRSLEAQCPVRIVTVARLVPEKGLEFSIRAVAQLVRACPRRRIEYTIAGDGPLAPKLDALIRDLGVTEHVRLSGWMDTDEVRDLLAGAHLFVLPSIQARDGAEEGAGVVLMEAQAAGLPVVATRVGGIPEVVCDGQSAFLVPEQDVNALGKALDWLIAHPESWAGMGRAGRDFVEKNFDITMLNERLVKHYQEIGS